MSSKKTYEERYDENYQKGIEIFYNYYCFDGEEHDDEASSFASDYAEQHTRK